jgi:hypothetical protein
VLSFADCPEFFPALPAKILSATRLDGRPVKFSQDERGFRFEVPETERDAIDTILKVTLSPDGPAAKDLSPVLVPTRSLACGKSVTASHSSPTAARLVDDDPATEWSPGERQCWVEVDLGTNRTFRRIDIREEGAAWEVRTKDFELLARADGAPAGQWQTIEHGTSIGATYSKSFPAVTARYVRLKINDSGVLPHFSEFQIYQ